MKNYYSNGVPRSRFSELKDLDRFDLNGAPHPEGEFVKFEEVEEMVTHRDWMLDEMSSKDWSCPCPFPGSGLCT